LLFFSRRKNNGPTDILFWNGIWRYFLGSRLRRDLLRLPLQAGSLDEIAEAIQTLYPYLSIEICCDLASHGYKEEVLGGPFVPKYDVRMSFHSDRMGCITEDLWPFMRNVSCPTLIVRGEKSPFLSREDARQMSVIIPKAEWVEIPQAMHMPVQENPVVFKRVISDFLNK
jgi:pimeloyl-ACP methyl ester carboxylesterase